MTFIGESGSRQEPLRQLEDCFAGTYPDFRVVRGVFKVGKSFIIQKAVEAFRDKGHTIEFWPRLTYNPLTIEELLSLVEQSSEVVVSSPPRSRIPAKQLERELESLRKAIATSRSISRAERLIISFALTNMGPAEEYIARGLLSGKVGGGDCICKFILEQRRPGNAISWPIYEHGRPEINRVIEIEAFSLKEALEYAENHLTPKNDNDQWRVSKTFLRDAIVSFSGRHPAILEATCGWANLGIRQSERRWNSCTSKEDAKSRIEYCVRNQYLDEARSIAEKILVTLPDNVQQFWRTSINLDPAQRLHNSTGELDTLNFVGLADLDGSVPDIFRLLCMGIATQEPSPIVEARLIDDLKAQIVHHYKMVISAEQNGAGEWSTRKDAVMTKIESKRAADYARFLKALRILQQSDRDHNYDGNLQEAFKAILD